MKVFLTNGLLFVVSHVFLLHLLYQIINVVLLQFIGFTESAGAALNLSGTMLGYYPVKVLPSKTAIAPVNPTLLPQVG